MRRFLIALCLLPIVAGCGFHLAGGSATALDNVTVVHEQPYRVVPPPLIDALDARLSDAGSDEATGRLVIEDVETVRRVSAVSPDDARATAYELVTTVQFEFLVDGQPRLQDQSLSTRREYSFNNSQRLSAGVERRELQAAMQEELADLILLRVETALDHRASGSE